MKLMEEETELTNSVLEGGAELPSFTICFRSFKKKIRPNFTEKLTFDNFMKDFMNMTDQIISAKYYSGSPIDKNRSQINLFDYINDDNIWHNSYYLQAQGGFYNGLNRSTTYYGINKCTTINSPIKNLIHPKDFWVSI